MKLVIFGLTISSSWGNGHATLLRGLFRALVAAGHKITFFEHDVPYYAAHRDMTHLEGVTLYLYEDWQTIYPVANRELLDADVGMVTSYCFDGVAASELVLSSHAPLRVFYDLDSPVTLASLSSGRAVSYIGPRGFADFDLVLSYTGGIALEELRRNLGARHVAPLYGSVDPSFHCPVAPKPHYSSDLSYLGTYAEDRQGTLDDLFLRPARQMRERKFVIGGASYPPEFPWLPNVFFVRHLPPSEHPAFYSSSRLTLNVTRSSMAKMGYCPSGRLFEAAACGTPILSDYWEGLEQFFQLNDEILVARCCEDAMQAISVSDATLARIGRIARQRVLDCHTAQHRAAELETILESAHSLSSPGVSPEAN